MTSALICLLPHLSLALAPFYVARDTASPGQGFTAPLVRFGDGGFSVIPNSSNAFPLLTEHNQPNDVPPSLVEGRASTTRCSCDAHSDVFTSLALLLASSPRSPGDGHQGRGRRPGSRRPTRQAA